ncbi:carbohydrate-binding module family 32 protein [Dothidotthia symphoricarpi CBS 119687]|uniref:alpha,alpha-trehalase n=1 Tax=Dothidotthia symphoricarpi CBS 119687 TaxID=1392245 RepID=A0A6A6AP96_9PLEO|nr:carbohydrate-binding module family 32 protein [Dothidotthia symphoricarpi CBS 119687]KAF2133356.1 carbohydrate-binding module family 32 protein [Dothidotthia symphoricarpi CBS 119687]
MRLQRLSILLAACRLVSSSQGQDQHRDQFKHVDWDDDNWTLSSRALDQGHYQSRLSLANGYVGISVAAAGPFFEVDKPVEGDNLSGWPLFSRRQTFSSIAGFFNTQPELNNSNYPWLDQYGWDSVISGIPHWSGLVVEANGAWLNASVNPKHISDFTTSLNVRAGIANWKYKWAPGGEERDAIDVDYELFVHKLNVNQAAVRLRLTAARDLNITVYDVLDGDCAVRSEFVDKKFEDDWPTIWTAVSPENMHDVTAYVYSTLVGDATVDMRTRSKAQDVYANGNEMTIAQSVQVKLKAEKSAQLSKFVGIASTDAFSDPQEAACNASVYGAREGYDTLLQSHTKEWHSILTEDSVDDYRLPSGSLPDDPNIRELHILAHTNPFYILSNTVGPNAIAAAGGNTRLDIHSIPVCGLASDCYAGQIYWDADAWMAPGLQVSHPQHAQNVIKYRVEHFEQAQRNVETAFTSSKNQTDRFTPGGAVFPWTSGRFGNCTGTGPCFDYEYHVNGDVCIAFNNHLAVTGDGAYFKETLLPISNAVAHFFGEVLDFNKSSGAYELWNATDPDEYANQVNNAGFTTALIQRQFIETSEFNNWFGVAQNANWSKIASRMQLPVNRQADIVVEYEGMNGTVMVKQADVVLIDDLLHYPNPYSLANLDYYAAKQSLDGPAMTYSSFSVVANQVSPSGCSSYTYDLYSSSPYIRAPWYQYSEQLIDEVAENGGTHPAYPFLTGMGGSNRVAVFGYLGLRLFYDRLDIDPSLPPQISYLDYRTFYWQGHGINATSNATHTTLIRLPREKYALPSANETYFEKPIPVTFGTRPGEFSLGAEPLVLPNRMMGQTLTMDGNILQCKSVLPSPQGNAPGQFPIAAIDGAASTKWQPANSSVLSYMTVDLGDAEFYPITNLMVDWGNQAPSYYEILFSNSSLPPFKDGEKDVRSVVAGKVELSAPYDPVTAFEIRTYVGNQTNVTLERSVWSGRFAHLGIKGNQFGDVEVGGTVAEWNLIREGEVAERENLEL